MSVKPPPGKGLGRGLSALIGEAPGAAPARPASGQRLLAIDLLSANPFQPRRVFTEEALDELTRSVKEKGVLQPILVRPDPRDPGRFQIIAGERRWRAAQRAGLHDVPVSVRAMNDAEALEIAIIENIQRADLNPIEEAAAYLALVDQFGHTQDALAKSLGKSRSAIANTLRLLTLPKSVQALLEKGSLSAGHARALVGLADADKLAQTIVAQGLSVRAAEALAAAAHEAARGLARRKPKPGADADTRALERSLSAALNCTVRIKPGARGEAGTLTISYADVDRLERITRKLLR